MLILLATLVAYGAQLGFELTDVDVHVLILTGRVESFDDLVAVLTQPLMQGRMPNALYWRPVTSLSYGFDAWIWGLAPFGYHLTDLLLHAATGLVLHSFTRRLWRTLELPYGATIALAAALLFVLHPVHVENVPAIARRTDMLAGLFVILTLRFLLERLRTERRWPGLAAQAACVLGMAAKETCFLIPAIGLLFCLCCDPVRQGTPRRALRFAGPLFAWGALLFVVRALLLLPHGDAFFPPDGAWWWRASNTLWVHIQGLLLPGYPEVWKFPPQWKFLATLSEAPRQHPMLVVSLLLGAAALALVATRATRKTSAEKRLLVFLGGTIVGLLLIHVGVNVHPRHLYTVSLFFSILLTWQLHAGCVALLGAANLRERMAAGLTTAVLGAVFLSLVSTSPLVEREGLEEWRASAEIAQDTLDRVDELVDELEPGRRLYLVNFPWRLDGPYIPWSVVLLEHSVQGWLDLRHPDKRFDVVGLSYLRLPDPRLRGQQLAFDARMTPDKLLQVRLTGAGEATRFPWSTQFGKGYDGTLHVLEGPHRGKSLDVRLVGEQGEPVFLVWGPDRVRLERGWDWQVSEGQPAR